MKLLAIETSTTACSVALWQDGVIHEQFEPRARQQTERVLPMVETLLAEAGWRRGDIEGLAFSRGPGAFTGVRVGTSVAQGLAMALDIPVAPVSSLAACALEGAMALDTDAPVLAAFDARMGEIYLGGYQRRGESLETLLEDCLCAPRALPELPGRDWFGVGSGGIYAEQMAAQLSLRGEWLEEVTPRARAVAMLGAPILARGEGVTAERALPSYLRNRVTQSGG